MSSNHAYQYSVVDMKFVMNDPEEYIIPENLEACKLLWSKNIFTMMCNNYDNVNSWITLNCLSEENKKIFDEMAAIDERFGSTWGGFGFRIPIKPKPGADTFEAFKELIDLFPMQDVQKDGYMTAEEFMTFYTDCFKMEINPEHKTIAKPKIEKYTDMARYSKDFTAYVDSVNVPTRIRVFDDSKMTKSVEEYIAESKFAGLYDSDEKKVYYNDMYYQAHLRYKEQMKAPKL